MLVVRLQVFDDDGAKGRDNKDQLICQGFFSTKQLEAAAILGTPLELTDGKEGGKVTGKLLVRSFNFHETA